MQSSGFRHEALLYEGREDFVARVSAFVREGQEAGATTLVMVNQPKIAALRLALGPDADRRVLFADMAAVGRNPACIIPAWQAFVDEQGPRQQLQGVGEPIGPDRDADALVECRQHEALLNVAFAQVDDFRLVCPYDTGALDPAVVTQAHGTHPLVDDHTSDVYDAYDVDASGLLAEPLRPAPDDAADWALRSPLVATRHRAVELAWALGFGKRAADVEMVVGELITNSVRYGGDDGRFRMWRSGGRLICETSDRGTITDPLVGRRRPVEGQVGGRGLWMANQVCDLLQVRSTARTTTVRAHLDQP